MLSDLGKILFLFDMKIDSNVIASALPFICSNVFLILFQSSRIFKICIGKHITLECIFLKKNREIMHEKIYLKTD